MIRWFGFRVPGARQSAYGPAAPAHARLRKLDFDQETAGGAGDEVEGLVVGADNAVHDGEAEAEASVLVGCVRVLSAPEGFGEGRHQVWSESMTRVPDLQHDGVAAAGQ